MKLGQSQKSFVKVLKKPTNPTCRFYAPFYYILSILFFFSVTNCGTPPDMYYGNVVANVTTGSKFCEIPPKYRLFGSRRYPNWLTTNRSFPNHTLPTGVIPPLKFPNPTFSRPQFNQWRRRWSTQADFEVFLWIKRRSFEVVSSTQVVLLRCVLKAFKFVLNLL